MVFQSYIQEPVALQNQFGGISRASEPFGGAVGSLESVEVIFVCFSVLQMRGRTPNTRLGRELRMWRWPSGGRVFQVTHLTSSGSV